MSNNVNGVKFEDIQLFINEYCGGRNMLEHLTCGEVLNRFVLPCTAASDSSFAVKIHCDDVYPVEIFPSEAALIISHAMEDPFLDVIDALHDYLSAIDTSRENPDLWIDLFCVNYHSTDPNEWVEEVSTACRKIGNTVLIMSPWDSLHVFHNPLCLYQIYFTGLKGMLLDVAMTKKEFERFSRVSEVSKETIERILTTNIRMEKVLRSFESYAPANAERTLFSELLTTVEHQKSFCQVIYDKIREWLREFYENRTFLTVPTNHSADLYTFKVSEWVDKSLIYFDRKVNSSTASTPRSPVSTAAATSSMNILAATGASTPGRSGARSIEDKIAFYKEYLEGDEAYQLGRAHQSVVNVMEYLVKLHRDAGDYHGCLHCLHELLNVFEEHRGRFKPETLQTLLRIALLQRKIVKFDSASQIHAPGHSESARSDATREEASRQRILEAEAILLDIVERLQHVYEENHPNILVLRKLRAEMLYEYPIHNFDEALSVYQSLYDIIQPVVGYKHPIALELINRMGFIMIYHFYRVIDGLTLAGKALENVLSLYGQHDPVVALYEANYYTMIDTIHRYDRENGVSTAIPSHLMMFYDVPAMSPSIGSSSSDVDGQNAIHQGLSLFTHHQSSYSIGPE